MHIFWVWDKGCLPRCMTPDGGGRLLHMSMMVRGHGIAVCKHIKRKKRGAHWIACRLNDDNHFCRHTKHNEQEAVRQQLLRNSAHWFACRVNDDSHFLSTYKTQWTRSCEAAVTKKQHALIYLHAAWMTTAISCRLTKHNDQEAVMQQLLRNSAHWFACRVNDDSHFCRHTKHNEQEAVRQQLLRNSAHWFACRVNDDSHFLSTYETQWTRSCEAEVIKKQRALICMPREWRRPFPVDIRNTMNKKLWGCSY